MSQVIVTKQNADGTYDEVGMNNRRPMELKTERGIIGRCKSTGFCRRNKREKIRMEWFHRLSDDNPLAVTYAVIEPTWGDVEYMSGADANYIRWKIGRISVGETLLTAAREARPKKMRTYTREQRRGWALCVLNCWNDNRGEYVGVMSRRAYTPQNIWGK